MVISSAIFRALAKAMVLRPPWMQCSSRSVASPYGLPVGLMRTNRLPRAGEPSSSTRAKARAVRLSANSAGLLMVAEQAMKRG
jgi:hypothetical protein